MTLRDTQRTFARSLAGPPGSVSACDDGLPYARRALVAKRRRAAEHLLPAVRDALGQRWQGRFDAHAAAYMPEGLLSHVDDAWAFACALDGPAETTATRRAAAADLLALRLHYVRRPREHSWRIRERRGMLVVRIPGSGLAIRWPGGAVWTLRWTRRLPVRC